MPSAFVRFDWPTWIVRPMRSTSPPSIVPGDLIVRTARTSRSASATDLTSPRRDSRTRPCADRDLIEHDRHVLDEYRVCVRFERRQRDDADAACFERAPVRGVLMLRALDVDWRAVHIRELAVGERTADVARDCSGHGHFRFGDDCIFVRTHVHRNRAQRTARDGPAAPRGDVSACRQFRIYALAARPPNP